MTALSAETVLVRDPELVASLLDDQVVVLSIRAGVCFDFNSVGTLIWNMLGEPRRVDEICRALLQSHDVDAETVKRDVTAFLLMLLERGLLRIVDCGSVR